MQIPRIVPALALGALLLPAGAAAQTHAHPNAAAMPTSGYRAEVIQDVEQLEQKFVGLAQAMNGKYAWSPAQGVRSTGAVFMHVAFANYLLPSMIGIAPPEGMAVANMQEAMALMQQMEKESDPAKVMETLKASFTHAKHAIAMTPDDQLDAPAKFFGRDVTKRFIISVIANHLHEHLGQSIAYARSNGVVPPWSASGGI